MRGRTLLTHIFPESAMLKVAESEIPHPPSARTHIESSLTRVSFRFRS